MQATIGDRLHVRGKVVGTGDHVGEIIEVRGVRGAPPYVVRFGDGHTGLVFPGPDAVVERAQAAGSGAASRSGRDGKARRRRVGW